MFDIAEYTKLILSPEIQTILEPYRNVFILVSLFFITISLFLIFNERYFVSEVKRRVLDFLSDPRKYKKSRKFVKWWVRAENCFKHGDDKKAIIAADYLLLKIFKRFGYVGDDCSLIINNYGIKEGGFPNLENVKRISELKKSFSKREEVEITKEEMRQIFDLLKDTLIKIGILDK